MMHTMHTQEPTTANTESLITTVAADVRKKMEGEGSGHDWFHIERVWKIGKRIAEEEGANTVIVELACLCHDLADWKFYNGDEMASPRAARELLSAHGVSEEIITAVCDIIATSSFKGAGVRAAMKSIEGKVLQDADRLDAIGAIGIARAFAYGGHKNRVLHDPSQEPVMHATKEAYIQAAGTTVNHFYEKLLLLKSLMNTKTGKRLAEERHRVMEQFLDRFYAEWDGAK